jgi:hypothetical protein
MKAAWLLNFPPVHTHMWFYYMITTKRLYLNCVAIFILHKGILELIVEKYFYLLK